VEVALRTSFSIRSSQPNGVAKEPTFEVDVIGHNKSLTKGGYPPADGRSRASSDFKAEEREHGKGVELNHLLTYDPQCVEPARLKICA